MNGWSNKDHLWFHTKYAGFITSGHEWSSSWLLFENKWEMHNIALKHPYACKRVFFIAKITICGSVAVCLSIASFHRSSITE